MQVKITHAEYWDVDTNQAVQLFKMAEAVVTGKPPGMGKPKMTQAWFPGGPRDPDLVLGGHIEVKSDETATVFPVWLPRS